MNESQEQYFNGVKSNAKDDHDWSKILPPLRHLSLNVIATPPPNHMTMSPPPLVLRERNSSGASSSPMSTDGLPKKPAMNDDHFCHAPRIPCTPEDEENTPCSSSSRKYRYHIPPCFSPSVVAVRRIVPALRAPLLVPPLEAVSPVIVKNESPPPYLPVIASPILLDVVDPQQEQEEPLSWGSEEPTRKRVLYLPDTTASVAASLRKRPSQLQLPLMTDL
jgi:hypothetical protein